MPCPVYLSRGISRSHTPAKFQVLCSAMDMRKLLAQTVGMFLRCLPFDNSRAALASEFGVNKARQDGRRWEQGAWLIGALNGSRALCCALCPAQLEFSSGFCNWFANLHKVNVKLPLQSEKVSQQAIRGGGRLDDPLAGPSFDDPGQSLLMVHNGKPGTAVAPATWLVIAVGQRSAVFSVPPPRLVGSNPKSLQVSGLIKRTCLRT